MKLRKNVLQMTAAEVPLDEDVSELVAGMRIVMDYYNGCGLAANQVGILKRVVIINTPAWVTVIINPEIVSTKGKKRMSIEGCLSFPGKQVRIRRYADLVVKGYDEHWQPIERRVRGLTAFCVQHEIDHLNGVTI